MPRNTFECQAGTLHVRDKITDELSEQEQTRIASDPTDARRLQPAEGRSGAGRPVRREGEPGGAARIR
jgi:hypothetical protein